MRNQFVVYYSSAIKQQLDSGKPLEDDFRLSVIKPLHAQQLVDIFNIFTTEKGAEIVIKGWKKAGIVGILDGTIELPCENPFEAFL